MASANHSRGTLMTDINVTPLVDIMLVLLIVFMLTSGALTPSADQQIPIELPTAASGETAPRPPLSIVIDARGGLHLDGKLVDNRKLKAAITARVQANTKASAVLSADRRIDHGTVVGVVDTVRQLGVTDVAINTRAQEIAPQGAP
ncbi:MAG: biopolymer transporter ExbD [Myxococcales bacterium]|nr:biopolymer transporter ExbD [Myxococcales bacterium]